MTRHTITIDTTAVCPECRKPGSGQTENGLCLGCTTRAMDPDARMRSAQGKKVQARWIRTRRRTADTRARLGMVDAAVADLADGTRPVGGEEPGAPRVAVSCNAYRFGIGWLNAFVATSQDESRPALFRTLSVEVFPQGVQLIGCDGTILLRSWVPANTEGEVPMPLLEEAPERAVVVMDVEKFALGFVRTLTSMAGQDANRAAWVELSVEPAAPPEEPGLGDLLASEVLVLKAFGQRLSCRLFEGPFPDWRALRFGLDAAERVEGMRLAVRLFGCVGKLKGILGVDCEFHGAERQIVLHGVGAAAEVRGLLMPMRRDQERAGAEGADAGADAGEESADPEGAR